MRAPLHTLPTEVLIEIFDFLAPNDFARYSPIMSTTVAHFRNISIRFITHILISSRATSGTSKFGALRNDYLTRPIWIKFLGYKWSLTDTEVKAVIGGLTTQHLIAAFSLRELYPMAHPMAFDVFSNEAVGLMCSKNTAEFQGFVGTGNQSVQTSTPFPALCALVPDTWLSILEECARTFAEKMITFAPPQLLPNSRFASRRHNHSVPAKKQNLFCTPFVYESNGKSSSFILPRFIAYYEVLLTKRAKSSYLSNRMTDTMEENESATECVAVGLATKAFELKKLPGWDNDSYGYHGDDGAIFHGRGRQLATYGPSFGAGDTVGCGIDYESRSIFFTLNGKYHGTAFGGIDLADGQVLYPTVGIDAAVNVTFNFGREKFKFDLLGYIARRENETRLFQQHPPKSTLRRNVSRIFV